MIACVDVYYRDDLAIAACVLFQRWTDDVIVRQHCTSYGPVGAYRPGEFYRRELPPILQVLDMSSPDIETVVVDGYVWLDNNHRPGLGAHLYRALKEEVAVVGVAKNRFREADFACPVYRGRSRRPLYVTAAGMDTERAAGYIEMMHGQHRIPFMLAEVDRLCRRYPIR